MRTFTIPAQLLSNTCCPPRSAASPLEWKRGQGQGTQHRPVTLPGPKCAKSYGSNDPKMQVVERAYSTLFPPVPRSAHHLAHGCRTWFVPAGKEHAAQPPVALHVVKHDGFNTNSSDDVRESAALGCHRQQRSDQEHRTPLGWLTQNS